MTPRRRRATGERAGDGGVAARRAVVRWAWRLFRREWRQQLLVLALLTLAVAATIFGVSATYNLVPSADARFGTATYRLELDRADRSRLDTQVATVGAWFGTVDVIGRRAVPVPGSVRASGAARPGPSGRLRQADAGATGRPLALHRGEVAVTDAVAATFQTQVGGTSPPRPASGPSLRQREI